MACHHVNINSLSHYQYLHSQQLSVRGQRRGANFALKDASRQKWPTQASVVQGVEEPNLSCDTCKAMGWIVCDFCNGQKTNVQVMNNRIYRRCPSCRAAGVLVCPQCKVFKCVSFPDGKDGGFEM